MDEQAIKRTILSCSKEDRRVYRASLQKFERSHSFYIILLYALAVLQFIAIAFFVKGFLFTLPISVVDASLLSKKFVHMNPLGHSKSVLLIINNEDLNNVQLKNNLTVYSSFGDSESTMLMEFAPDHHTKLDNVIENLPKQAESLLFMENYKWGKLINYYNSQNSHVHPINVSCPIEEMKELFNESNMTSHFRKAMLGYYYSKSEMEQIPQIMNLIDDDTLLMIVGQDSTRNKLMFLYSKRTNYWGPQNRHIKARSFDLPSSLSWLLNLQLPNNNVGWPIPELMQTNEVMTNYSKLVLEQLRAYQQATKLVESDVDIIELNKLYENGRNDIQEARQFQQKFLFAYKNHCQKFDYHSLAAGMILLLFSVLLLTSITKLIPSIIVNQMVPEFAKSILAMLIVSNIYLNGVYYIFKQPVFVTNQIWCIALATSIGIIIGCSIPIFYRYSFRWLFVRFIGEFADYWSLIGGVILVTHASLFISNSLTIWEDQVVTFFMITFGIVTLYEFVFIPQRQSTNAVVTAVINEHQGTASGVSTSMANSYSLPLTRFARFLGVYHSLVLIVCTRITSLITTCRADQFGKCKQTFTVEVNGSWWCIAILAICLIVLPRSIKGYYNLSSSYQAAAPIWIDKLMIGGLLANLIYWTLNVIEGKYIDIPFDIPLISMTLARLISCFSMVICNIAWALGPLCIKLNVENADMKSQQTTILGYSNIYGAPYFLLVINAIMSIIFFNKPLAQISIALMCNQMLSTIEIIDLLKLKESVIGPIILGLLSYQQFFSTGHQFTFPSIQWDSGFILLDRVFFPTTHLSIIINTFGSFILVALSVALLTLWRQPPDILTPQTLLGRIVSNCGMLVTYHTIICLSSFIWATYFRYHPLVWNIFCPRFLFTSLSLIVTQLVITFGTITFASGRLIRHINDIFWR